MERDTNTHIHTPGLCSAVAGHTSKSPSFHLPPDCWRLLTRRPQSAEGPEEGPSILAAACFCLPCWINDAIGWHTHSHTSSRLTDLIEWGLVVKRPCIWDVSQFCRPCSSAARCHRGLWRTNPLPFRFSLALCFSTCTVPSSPSALLVTDAADLVKGALDLELYWPRSLVAVRVMYSSHPLAGPWVTALSIQRLYRCHLAGRNP